MELTDDIRVGLLYSLTGSTGITERGQYQSTLLAVKQINEQGGIYGRRLLPIVEDITSDPFLAAQKAEKLILHDKVSALIGLYTSACRKMVIPVLEKYNVLLFYPTLYEGEELSRNIFYCGPLPNQQLQFFIPWIIGSLGKSFYLIGSDYIYPRETNRHIHRLVKSHNGQVVGESYSPLGTQKFDKVLREIAQTNPDVVFSTLVGESAVAFYQRYYNFGINKPIASSITAETEVLVMNPLNAAGHYTSFPYFKVDEQNHHLWLYSRIGRVNEKGQFDIVYESPHPIAPVPFLNHTGLHKTGTALKSTLFPEELKASRNNYQLLINKLKTATRLLPYTFAFFDKHGFLLETFRSEEFGEPESIPLLNPGTCWATPVMERSGVTLALFSQTESIIFGKDHDVEDLRDWVTIGIPIKGIAGSLKGILGVFHDLAEEETTEIVIHSLSQIVESCVETVDKYHKCEFLNHLARDMSKFIADSFLVVKDNEVLLCNDQAQNLLTKNQLSAQELFSKIDSRNPADSEMFTRERIKDNLYEIRTIPFGQYSFVFLKILGPEKQDKLTSSQILFSDIIGSDRKFLRTIEMARTAANIDANVLILGESGTGKELFARAIHNSSPRKHNPFVAINCGSVSRELIHSELFGYVEGSFTGAKKGGSLGKFEVAKGGTLFLDEIGDMPLELQATLLRVLQEREVVRVGGHTPIPIDVRIIAATNKKLSEEIAYKGSFRSDLYYRLNVFTIELIPLRERIEDIPELLNYFNTQLNATTELPPKTLANDALKLLLQYRWPGNIRELKNVIDRSFYLAGDSRFITTEHLPAHILTYSVKALKEETVPENSVNIKKRGKQVDIREINELLVQYRGNLSKVAQKLGISRTTLYRRLKDAGEYSVNNTSGQHISL